MRAIFLSAKSEKKSETAVANAMTFEIAFSAIGSGADGYAKPNSAHTAKTKNILANSIHVYRDIFMIGDNESKVKLETSMRKSGKK